MLYLGLHTTIYGDMVGKNSEKIQTGLLEPQN